jgi:hypothetical protein
VALGCGDGVEPAGTAGARMTDATPGQAAVIDVGFSVDTGLFRQLGELLVGRDATAIAKLVNNAYDADATEVVLTATGLEDERAGTLTLVDDGIGMTLEQFGRGFLRVAARTKISEGRVSPVFGRRYTGEKGVGRLAAHKLAAQVRIRSIAAVDAAGSAAVPRLRGGHPDWKLR